MEKDLYAVLNVTKDADLSAIKKAYRRLCLKYHPDKNDGFRKEFDQVQKAYYVLGDTERRSVYDVTGQTDGKKYEIFNEVTAEMIEKDRQEYQGSEEEREDIKQAMLESRGNFEKLFEVIVHLEFSTDEEERVFKIVEEIVANQELDITEIPRYSKYCQERSKRIKKLENKRRKEEKEFIAGNKQNSMEELALMISGNRKRQADALSSIIEKYSSGKVEKPKKKTPGKKPKRKVA